jgi:hypothetical protein
MIDKEVAEIRKETLGEDIATETRLASWDRREDPTRRALACLRRLLSGK